ncbi:nucleotide-binding alpha-beta plait domain-containing protein [Tanacetum coccineum]
MASTRASISKVSKRPKINIIPPKQLFVDLTQDDTTTPSPKLPISSPSAPNAPSKTPSTKDTSSSSIDYIPKSPTSSTSLSPNGYLNPPTSPPPRVSPPPPTQENASMDITLTLSPITPLDVLMNLTNENSVGCRQIAVCGGLETLCGLIAGHYPSFSSYLPNFSDQVDKLIVLEGHNKRLNDQELDFLIDILVLLVNLVEKDGRNRSRLLRAGEAAEEGRQSVWNDEDPIVREKTIVEAYSALLLAFISTERKRDTPLMGIHKVPSYIPTYELVAGHQIVYFEVNSSWRNIHFMQHVTLVGSLKELGKAVIREMLFICFTKAIIWDLASWRNIYFMQQVTLVDSLKELGKRTGTTSLYQSYPWVLAILPNGEASGILADTTKRCEVLKIPHLYLPDSTVKLTAPSPFPVITFGPFASAIEVLTSLSHAVGTVFMPPKWSLVYQQCRKQVGVSDKFPTDSNYRPAITDDLFPSQICRKQLLPTDFRRKWLLGKTILDVNFLWKEERVRLLVGSPRASTTPSYYPGPSTPPNYSPGPSKNAECANCKLLIGKLQDLWKACNQYGSVVDAFIPNRRSKVGKRFGFVHFVKVFDVDRLVNNLCTIWVDRFKYHANKARFQRHPKNSSNVQYSKKGDGKLASNVGSKDSGIQGYSNSYIHVVIRGTQPLTVEEESKPTLVLDESCLNQNYFSTCLMGKVKEFSSLTNFKVVFANEGIVFWVRAKEVSGWIPDFVEDEEEDNDSDDGIRDNGLEVENADKLNYEDAVADSEVEESEIRSEDPFNIYDLLNKKQDNNNGAKICNVIHGLKPVLLMVLVQATFAGVNVLYKLAASDGMHLPILVAYRFLFATAFICPIALLVERKKRPKLTWMILLQAFGCGLFGYETAGCMDWKYVNVISINPLANTDSYFFFLRVTKEKKRTLITSFFD